MTQSIIFWSMVVLDAVFWIVVYYLLIKPNNKELYEAANPTTNESMAKAQTKMGEVQEVSSGGTQGSETSSPEGKYPS